MRTGSAAVWPPLLWSFIHPVERKRRVRLVHGGGESTSNLGSDCSALWAADANVNTWRNQTHSLCFFTARDEACRRWTDVNIYHLINSVLYRRDRLSGTHSLSCVSYLITGLILTVYIHKLDHYTNIFLNFGKSHTILTNFLKKKKSHHGPRYTKKLLLSNVYCAVKMYEPSKLNRAPQIDIEKCADYSTFYGNF